MSLLSGRLKENQAKGGFIERFSPFLNHRIFLSHALTSRSLNVERRRNARQGGGRIAMRRRAASYSVSVSDSDSGSDSPTPPPAYKVNRAKLAARRRKLSEIDDDDL